MPAARRPIRPATRGIQDLITYRRLMTKFCRWARQAKSESLHILAMAVLQIPAAFLPCKSLCAALFHEPGWGAPFP